MWEKWWTSQSTRVYHKVSMIQLHTMFCVLHADERVNPDAYSSFRNIIHNPLQLLNLNHYQAPVPELVEMNHNITVFLNPVSLTASPPSGWSFTIVHSGDRACFISECDIFYSAAVYYYSLQNLVCSSIFKRVAISPSVSTKSPAVAEGR